MNDHCYSPTATTHRQLSMPIGGLGASEDDDDDAASESTHHRPPRVKDRI